MLARRVIPCLDVHDGKVTRGIQFGRAEAGELRNVGDPVELHPPDKRPVAKRLAMLALDEVYHAQNSPKSPAVVDWKTEGGRIAVRFDHAETLTWKAGFDRGFEIAGRDGKFHPATAELRGGTAMISSPAVPAPVAFRYAWGNAPDSILFNEAELPAAPFRSGVNTP